MSKPDKPQADRIRECMVILNKLVNEVGILATNPSIRLLKKRMGTYWRDGKLQEDRMPLYGYDRVIMYRFPRLAHQEIEVTLRQIRAKRILFPPELLAELEEMSTLVVDASSNSV